MSESIVDEVRRKYAASAASELSGSQAGVRAVAEAFGYSPEQLAALPAEANLGLSCGNPTAFASLKEGEVVVDLGCGAGIDVLLASAEVGPSGRAIGIDMTPEMIERAKANAARMGADNVEFHLAAIDSLPLGEGCVDCLVSNCVLNLAPDKRAVFREMFRVLKPGGRVAVSDIALKKALPDDLARDVAAYVGCVAGAISFSDYESGLRDAGFADVQIVPTGADLNSYSMVEGQSACCTPAMQEAKSPSSLTLAPAACCEPTVHEGLASLMAKYDVNEYAAAVQVYALKRGGSTAPPGRAAP